MCLTDQRGWGTGEEVPGGRRRVGLRSVFRRASAHQGALCGPLCATPERPRPGPRRSSSRSDGESYMCVRWMCATSERPWVVHGPLSAASEYSTLSAAGLPRPYCKPCNSQRVRLGNYSVTKEFVDLLLEFQRGRCAICGAPDSGAKAMHVDHDHTCCPGRRSCGDCVRGLLCSTCNWRGLAWYEALPAALRSFDVLNDYLANPPARQMRAGFVAALDG
ncbi:endonuclease domain-containing protein [Streptomyces sp. NPDC005492]|uniref:endonuclease domain-containing protein n=1 Tax=Streptomyces sp. NPDC005492 TaxID=3156883 RepID=UPI0033A5BCDC